MNKYYSLSPSNKTEIHNLLSPIFELVRKNKIHSYNQLQKREDINSNTIEIDEGSYIFQPKPKTAQNMPQSRFSEFQVTRERFTHYSMYSPKPNAQPKTPSFQYTRNHETVEPAEQKQSRQKPEKKKSASLSRKQNKKMFRVNSKIKKHLVQEIDFEEIEKMFYKKRNAITRYQHFLNSKKEDKPEQNAGKMINIKLGTRDRNKINVEKYDDHFPRGQIKQHNQGSLNREWMTLPVKCPHRKKFWVKQNSRRHIINSEYPRIQGTAFKTINP